MNAGDRFGSWTVLDPLVEIRKKNRYARVQCDCGLICLRAAAALRHGQSTSCKKCYLGSQWLPIGTSRDGWKLVHNDAEMKVFECEACTRRTSHAGTSWPGKCSVCHPPLITKALTKKLGVSHQGIRQRIRRGWSKERATSTPRTT